jgi:hypothetical protein
LLARNDKTSDREEKWGKKLKKQGKEQIFLFLLTKREKTRHFG